MTLSKQQTNALELMKGIEDELNPQRGIILPLSRWFHQAELPGITLHTMKALVEKGLIEQIESSTTGQLYYRMK